MWRPVALQLKNKILHHLGPCIREEKSITIQYVCKRDNCDCGVGQTWNYYHNKKPPLLRIHKLYETQIVQVPKREESQDPWTGKKLKVSTLYKKSSQ